MRACRRCISACSRGLQAPHKTRTQSPPPQVRAASGWMSIERDGISAIHCITKACYTSARVYHFPHAVAPIWVPHACLIGWLAGKCSLPPVISYEDVRVFVNWAARRGAQHSAMQLTLQTQPAQQQECGSCLFDLEFRIPTQDGCFRRIGRGCTEGTRRRGSSLRDKARVRPQHDPCACGGRR